MLNWINPENYSFNSSLLLERFQIRLMMESGGWHNNKSEWRSSMGIALNANPVIMWYLMRRCPECAQMITELVANTPVVTDVHEIRAAEVYALSSVENFVIYTTPEAMDESCDFNRGWNKEHLFELADFRGKTVLDVGAGSGRLTFAAAERSAWVYASEPVGTLREFIRDRITKEGIKNTRVADGFINELPYVDNSFDIVMSGHVIGDDYEAETSELTRVCRPGGWLIDCPGDSVGDIKPEPELLARGWEEFYYVGSFDKDVYTYRKQIFK